MISLINAHQIPFFPKSVDPRRRYELFIGFSQLNHHHISQMVPILIVHFVTYARKQGDEKFRA